MQAHARLANVHAPQLHTHDRFGRRIDEVEFHPSYHALMAGRGRRGPAWHALGARRSSAASPHVQRAAGFMLFTELEPSILCPISMTYAVTPALRSNAGDLSPTGRPRLTSRAYDPALKPWNDKAGVTMGMGMTEKQGGSDVRANTTRAEPDGQRRLGRALPRHRPQVVLLGADVRRLPGAGADRLGPVAACSCRACCPMAAATRSASSA